MTAFRTLMVKVDGVIIRGLHPGYRWDDEARLKSLLEPIE